MLNTLIIENFLCSRTPVMWDPEVHLDLEKCTQTAWPLTREKGIGVNSQTNPAPHSSVVALNQCPPQVRDLLSKYWGWEIIGLSFHITCTTVLVPKISVACTCCFSDVPGFKTFQMALKPLLLWNFRGTFLQSLFLYVCLKVFFIFLFKYMFTYFTLDLNLIHLYFIYL